MVKTFNPNRVGGGTVSIVRAADGTYSLKETGFDQISSLNMIDLGAVATTTTAAKTETAAEKTGTTVEDQTKAAFLLPKQDRGDDPFTTEKMLKSATDVSKGLSDSATQTMIANQEAQEQAAGVSGVNPFRNIDTGVGEFAGIKDPTEPVFGSSMPSKEQFERQDMLPSVETPQKKLAVTSANVQKGLVDPPGITNPFKDMLGSKFQTEKGTSVNVDKGRGSPLGERYRSEVAQGGSTGFLSGIDTRSDQGLTEVPATALGISADPSKTMAMKQAELASGTITPRVPDAIIQGQPSVPAKKTFIESATTALKNVGDTAAKLAAMSPTVQLFKALGKQRNEDRATIGLNNRKFNVVTSPGAMQGRIVGDDGTYDPANNLFHGMNRNSAFGNLEKAGKKRIDRISKTIEKKKARGQDTSNLENRKNKFENELKDYQREKAAEQKATQGPAGGATTDSGGGGGSAGGKIVCTMMNQSYGFGSFRNKIWMKFHKDLSPEYQKGYHRLFLPLVRIAKTNKIIKNILEHIAVHSTIDMRQSMRGKKHLLGRVYRKILLPICYWAGKK